MKKLLLLIIMLILLRGTVSAESNTMITTQVALENSQESRVAKTKNTKNQKKAKLIKSKLAMILVLGHATTKNGARPYASQN